MTEESGSGRFEGEEQHGWAPDVGAEGKTTAGEAGAKAQRTPSGEVGEGREVSPEEEKGVHPAETEPGSPFGAGESTTTSGEEISSGDEGTEGYKGESQRPYGKGEATDSTGVNPQEPIEPSSPSMPPGDQGG
jgi:hypothetical protein